MRWAYGLSSSGRKRRQTEDSFNTFITETSNIATTEFQESFDAGTSTVAETTSNERGTVESVNGRTFEAAAASSSSSSGSSGSSGSSSGGSSAIQAPYVSNINNNGPSETNENNEEDNENEVEILEDNSSALIFKLNFIFAVFLLF